ncbi:MAG TPA: OmpA family protein [Phenylobacterium sp.]|uniref:OmpA family protein n=1 Tax=Phenylobacterium sp. TaxID=1871053 RepID=UPI002B4596AB|nr:OmpA family protein [Phenylobacterium sp.]HKR86875.1 OmpA family protein [Phenylobacterium sp.]
MANLIQTVMGALTPNVTARLADAMGESPSALTTGLGAAAPALLAGALQRSATPAGARSLLDQVNQTVANGNPLDDLGAVAGDESARAAYLSHGQSVASSLLGGEGNAVTSAIASHAGLGMASAAKILGLAAPLVMGAIARLAGPAPTAGGLQTLLSGQRPSILGALPAGLGSLFGLGASARTGAAAADSYAAHAVSSGAATTAGAARTAEAGGGVGRFLPWIIAALVLVGLLFAMRNCAAARKATEPTTTATAPTATAPTATAPNVTAPAAPNVSVNLPSGGAITVPQGSIGYNLANYLASNTPAPKTFVFDNLNYDTASSELTPASQPTVTAITSILKAYPNAMVKVVGFTDNQGDAASNQQLSERRATMVKSQLVAGGVPADHVEASGMGQQNPVADNNTDAGRAANRRTELVVVKK